MNVSPAVPSLHPLGRGRVVIPNHPAICSWVREHVLWAQRGRHPGPALSIPSASPSLAVHSPVVLFPVATSASFQLNPVGVSGCSPLTVQLSCSSCVRLCDPTDCSTPGFPVLQQVLVLAQTHEHRVSDAFQPSHSVVPFSSCLQSFPASGYFPMSQFFTSSG